MYHYSNFGKLYNMKQRILTGWNLPRALYLIIGIYIIFQSVIERKWLGIFLGLYFASMGLFAFGCASGSCYGNNCSIENSQENRTKNIEPEFEDIKSN